MGIGIIWLEADWGPLIRNYREPADFPAIETAVSEGNWLRPWAIDEDVDSLLSGFNSLFFLTDEMDSDLHSALVEEFPVLRKIGILWDAEKGAPAMIMDVMQDESEQILCAINPSHAQEYSDEFKSLNTERMLKLPRDFEFGGEASFFASPEDFLDFPGRYSKGLSTAASKGVGIPAVCYG